ncbi:hypothetical protein LUZ60_016318 [Juncus effusus]|nr:hypothetical protein LUZ60_016318 [Juncus effusus]
MAEALSIVTRSCECMNAIGLPASVAAQARSFFSIDDNLCSLKDESEKLQAIKTAVELKVYEELNKLRDCNPQVKYWLTRVQAIPEDIKTLEEDYEKLTRCGFFCNCTPNFSRRQKLGKRIVKKLQDADELIIEGEKLPEIGIDPPQDMVELRPQPKAFGMEPMLKQLQEYFTDNERCIIGVWGTGGVGKTTLLNLFNNDLKKHSEFHVVILIDVSNAETLNITGIQQTIIERLGLPWIDTQSQDARARLLIRALARKPFVILLDDVRKSFNLEVVGIPNPEIENGSKIILASRFEDVCNDMGAQHSLVKMQLLDGVASWGLFESNLGPEARIAINTNDSIRRRAEAINKSCGGLPLAIAVISRAVAGLKSPNDWRDAKNAISAGLVEIDGVNEMFLRLKYSYDKLDPVAKHCFLYCTLFPEYSSIRKDLLVEYWIGEGLILPNESWRGSYLIINKLISACLLQNTSSELKVRLHNVIRQFGIWLANQENNFLIKSGSGLDCPPGIKLWNGPKKISLMSNDIKDLSICPNCGNLETLLLQNNPNLMTLDPKFFKSMSNLRVLDLSNTAIKELPGSCDALVNLQYLNLSQTPIVKLPKKFWILKELTHLDLSMTEALEETFNNCSKLLKLRVLNLFRSNYGIRDVSNLNLDTLTELNFLGITIYAEDVLRKLKKTDPLAKSTHRLSLKYCEGMESIHVADFNQMKHLEELYIESCQNLSELVVDQDESRVSHLAFLTLGELRSLHTISVKPLPHYFRKLRELTIYGCDKLENINWVTNLASLEKLVISRCDRMEQIVASINGRDVKPGDKKKLSEEQEIQTLMEESYQLKMNENDNTINEKSGAGIEFPRLRSVILIELKNLVSICENRDFPSLESIRVQGCPNLRRLPISQDHKIAKLRQICGSFEWWNGLQWGEKDMGSDLENFFIPI